MTLRNNDAQKLKLRQKTVQRFSFILNLIGAGTIANVALDLINVKAVLRRDGRDYVLFNEHLGLLAIESMFFEGFEHAMQKTPIVLSATYAILPLMVDLGTPINLIGNDELVVEVTTKVGWYADYTSADSSLEVEERESIGIETVIPFIKSEIIGSTETKKNISLGDNVTSIMLLNLEPARTNSNADRVWDSIIITSDKYNTSDSKNRLLSRRATQFETVAAAALRKENFRYVPNVELDGVQLTVELNGANVAATKNAIVYRSYLITADGINRASVMQGRHNEENTQKMIAQTQG